MFSIISLILGIVAAILIAIVYIIGIIAVMNDPQFQQKLKEAQEQQQRQRQGFNQKGVRYELPADWYVHEYTDSTPSSSV